jgi:squalene-hopene/tetraprenyl-beta-curcumene cyclase
MSETHDMESGRHVRLVSQDGYEDQAQHGESSAALAAPLRAAIARTRDWLLERQHPEGYWEAELEGDTILESEYILLLAYLGRHRSERALKAARYILDAQLAGGGWAIYPGGTLDISASVKAYFALKVTGRHPSDEGMARARAAILAHGGADAVNSFTRFYLALLGQISYEQCPAVPPEMLLLPMWFPINLYKVSAWSRTILVPLSIMASRRPVADLEPQLGISELFLKRPEQWPELRCPGKSEKPALASWDRFFRGLDRGLKWLERRGWTPLRRRALQTAEQWLIERFDDSEGLGAIFPPMIFSIVALRALGYRDDSDELAYCHKHLDGLMIEDKHSLRLQPCKSPVWDTAITLRALAAGGVDAGHESIQKGVGWLLSQEVRRRGDWFETVDAEPGGWCFEHANAFYPDVDDTVMVVMALANQFAGPAGDSTDTGLRLVEHRPTSARQQAHQRVAVIDRVAGAMQRALDWVLALQNRDGGWGAFDRDNDREFLCHVPFADHNAMIDPSTPDLAGRTLEMLGHLGRRVGEPTVDRAVAYTRSTQQADGSWFGRWGVNYIYGTWQTITGLAAVGVPVDDAAIATGAHWLIAHQQPSGGWGESPDSYAQPHLRGQGPVTASQTAWALLGLMAAGRHEDPAVARGVRYLLETQQPDGTWLEREFTGTGFPRVFYLRYHYYPIYFPLLALAAWARHIGTRLEEAETLRQRLVESAGATGVR